MARERFFLFALNGGMVSPLALARTDLARMRLTSEECSNCFPKVIGPLQLRSGLGYTAQTYDQFADPDPLPPVPLATLPARKIPFIFSATDTAFLELTNGVMRPFVDGSLIIRPAVSTDIPSGNFNTSTGWTLNTSGGADIDINSTSPGQLYMAQTNRGSKCNAERTFTVIQADRGKEHGLSIRITKGTALIRIGQNPNGQGVLEEAEYGEGYSEIAFTPPVGIGTLTLYISITTSEFIPVAIDYVVINQGHPTLGLTFISPWGEEIIDQLRYDQSGDVIFVTHSSVQPYRIERRGNSRSWALVKYKFRDGPWLGKTSNVSLSCNGRVSTGTLTASGNFFVDDHIGSLFQLTHTDSNRSRTLSGPDQFTDAVRISGMNEGDVRKVTYDVSGTWVGTLSIQTSYDQGDNWSTRSTITANPGAPQTFFPGTDNSIVLVRVGFKGDDYTSGNAVITLTSKHAGGVGVVRIIGVTDGLNASYEVITPPHQAGLTEVWQEGKFSAKNGWPSAVGLFDGRLWFGGSDQIAGSYSDDFTNFNVDEEGDAAPIVRSVAAGPVNKVQWLLALARLIIGTSGAESVARSTSFDEPITAANFSIKDASNYGSADIQAVKVDRSGIFVQRSGKRAFDLSFSIENQDYTSTEITRYSPTILSAGVKMIAVQRQPDTRIFFVLNDGTIAGLTYERSEDVISWFTMTTDGEFVDAVVLPNVDGDDVHFVVKRIRESGAGLKYYYYHEKLAYDAQAMGGTDNYMADSYVVRDITATTTVTGLGHLNGKDVVVWAAGGPLLDANGDPDTFTVSGAGEITLSAVTTGRVIVGLPYEGRWKSSKLAYAAQSGTAMSQKKNILEVAPLLYSTHNRAVLFGQDFTRMDALPRMIRGEDVGASVMLADYDYDAFTLPGSWSNDSRLCMKMRAPMPAVMLGVGMLMESHERS